MSSVAFSAELQAQRPPLSDPSCPACQDKRVHDVSEWLNHPLAGHGYTKETGWSHGRAKELHDAEVEALNAKRAASNRTPEAKDVH
jgi:hypothetical protein